MSYKILCKISLKVLVFSTSLLVKEGKVWQLPLSKVYSSSVGDGDFFTINLLLCGKAGPGAAEVVAAQRRGGDG